MRTRHDGDCNIYASLCNNRPEDGICTCGYWHENQYGPDMQKVDQYSIELQKKLYDQHGGEKGYRERCKMVEEFFGLQTKDPQPFIDKMKSLEKSE